MGQCQGHHYIKGTHAQDFIVLFSHFFWNHSIIDKTDVQSFIFLKKLNVKFSLKTGFSRIQRFRRKRTVSLRFFVESATFHSAYSPKTHDSASSLNRLYTAQSAEFYSVFSPTTISLTPRFRRKREV
jgi:hypothetical protein